MGRAVALGAAALAGCGVFVGGIGAQSQGRSGQSATDEIVRGLSELAQQFPDDATLRMRLSMALESAGRHEEARRWADEARRLGVGEWSRAAAPEGSDGVAPPDAQRMITCGGATGPDVIVGDFTEVGRWGRSGEFTSYSLGTISCNMGDAPLLWQADTDQHPIISQNIYRLKNGRFEQIGQSWLKHAFFALSETLCCSCEQGDGTALGVGCSDPYYSSLNGSQFRLGPKWQVNPVTGDYAWPRQDCGFGLFDGRLKLHDSDLDPVVNPGAIYFVESHYIAKDDIAAGNGMNSASYRRANVTASMSDPTRFQISIVSSGARRGMQAIFAWKELQPSVTIRTVDIPGDGRYLVGYDVSDNGDGTWHYEYAVQNFNSDRAAQTFSVPMPGGVGITNLGFRDVAYHSGDGIGGVDYDGADWPAVIAAGAVTWQMPTHEPNPDNSNALRWGTIYNFRFDATTPPAPADATLALFKPGSPTHALAAIAAPGAPACPPDASGDGVISAADLGMLLGAWGASGTPSDVNGDGVVNAADLGLLLGAWGPCP